MYSAVHRSFFFSTLILAVLASSGDRSADFHHCVTPCVQSQCHASQLSLPLRITQWTCADDCKYLCMHKITNRDVEDGLKIQQYYGKWPFWRFSGMQEPASVAFSVLNLLSHVRGALKIQKRVPDTHPMKSYYLTWSFISINSWVWSAVFHTRGQKLPRSTR